MYACESARRHSDVLSLRFNHQYLQHVLCQLVTAIDKLSYSFFVPWKQLKTAAQRHFFFQEGGFDAFLEVFKFSLRLNLVEDSIKRVFDLNLGHSTFNLQLHHMACQEIFPRGLTNVVRASVGAIVYHIFFLPHLDVISDQLGNSLMHVNMKSSYIIIVIIHSLTVSFLIGKRKN